MNKSLWGTIIFFVVVSISGLVIFLFWQLGVFKKEPPTSPKVNEIKKQIDFINKKSSSEEVQKIVELLEDLPTSKLEIPPVKLEELNRTQLF